MKPGAPLRAVAGAAYHRRPRTAAPFARVAELVDALHSECSGLKVVLVRFQSRALKVLVSPWLAGTFEFWVQQPWTVSEGQGYDGQVDMRVTLPQRPLEDTSPRARQAFGSRVACADGGDCRRRRCSGPPPRWCPRGFRSARGAPFGLERREEALGHCVAPGALAPIAVAGPTASSGVYKCLYQAQRLYVSPGRFARARMGDHRPGEMAAAS